MALSLGLELFDWQRWVVRWILAVDGKGQPAARQVILEVPRQNGKGAILECIELYWLIVAGVPVVILDAPYLLGTGLPGVHPDLAAVEQTLESLADPEARTALWMRQRDWYDAIRATRPEATLASRYRVVARVDGRADQGSMAPW